MSFVDSKDDEDAADIQSSSRPFLSRIPLQLSPVASDLAPGVCSLSQFEFGRLPSTSSPRKRPLLHRSSSSVSLESANETCKARYCPPTTRSAASEQIPISPCSSHTETNSPTTFAHKRKIVFKNFAAFAERHAYKVEGSDSALPDVIVHDTSGGPGEAHLVHSKCSSVPHPFELPFLKRMQQLRHNSAEGECGQRRSRLHPCHLSISPPPISEPSSSFCIDTSLVFSKSMPVSPIRCSSSEDLSHSKSDPKCEEYEDSSMQRILDHLAPSNIYQKRKQRVCSLRQLSPESASSPLPRCPTSVSDSPINYKKWLCHRYLSEVDLRKSSCNKLPAKTDDADFHQVMLTIENVIDRRCRIQSNNSSVSMPSSSHEFDCDPFSPVTPLEAKLNPAFQSPSIQPTRAGDGEGMELNARGAEPLSSGGGVGYPQAFVFPPPSPLKLSGLSYESSTPGPSSANSFTSPNSSTARRSSGYASFSAEESVLLPGLIRSESCSEQPSASARLMPPNVSPLSGGSVFSDQLSPPFRQRPCVSSGPTTLLQLTRPLDAPVPSRDRVVSADLLQGSSSSRSPTQRRASSSSSSSSSALSKTQSGSPTVLHVCRVCQRTFTRSDMLVRHSRVHTGHRPFACADCGQSFSRSDHLSTHQRTHTGQRPYRCSACPYTACRRDMITRHMRVHGSKNSQVLLVSSDVTATMPVSSFASSSTAFAAAGSASVAGMTSAAPRVSPTRNTTAPPISAASRQSTLTELESSAAGFAESRD